MDELDWVIDHLQSLLLVAAGLIIAIYANYGIYSVIRSAVVNLFA